MKFIEGNLEKHLDGVRKSMSILGYEIVHRPIPTIVSSTPVKGSYYDPIGHVIGLVGDSGIKTLWHELCHSQQPMSNSARLYRNKDGTINPTQWMSDPLEIQACEVEKLVDMIDHPKLQAAIELLDRVGIQISTDWLVWVMHGDIKAKKPSRLGRRTRLTVNAVIRSQSL
jgi:hypothetical protein